MRAFSLFLLAIVGTLCLAAGLAYPVYSLLHGHNEAIAFHKVASRLWQFTMLGGVAFVVWRLRLRRKADWGYGLPRPRFLRQLGIAVLVGLLTMLPVAATILALGLRVPRADADVARLVELFFSGALTGFAVGFLEETFYRGLLLGAMRREVSPWVAVPLTAMLYASLHFLARTKIPHADVHPGVGFEMLGQSLRYFLAPSTMIDSFLALTAVGVLLGLVRLWTGSIAACIGLHAGWVWVMKMTIGSTQLDPAAPHAAWISPIDGFTGWAVFAWTVALTLAVVVVRRRFLGWRTRDSR